MSCESKPAEKSQRVLVYRIGQLGDTIVALPAMRAIRDHFKDAHIELLCDRHKQSNYVLAADLLAPMHLFDGFITYDVNRQKGKRQPHFADLMRLLRSKQFDTVVYLAPVKRTRWQIVRDWLFFRLSGIKHFVGFRNFRTIPPKRFGQPLPKMPSEGELLLERLAADGIKVPRPEEYLIDIDFSSEDEQCFARWIAACPLDKNRKWVGVGPGSKMPAKRWPLERFEQVVSALIEEFNIWPVVFGGPEDKLMGDELIAKWGHGCNAASALDLRSAMVAMKRCVFFLGNDTGTMHMAAAVGLQCVALFSSREHPGLWYPQGQGHRVFRSAIECEGCELVECVVRANECLKRISADAVLSACAELLSARTSSRLCLGSHLEIDRL